MIWLLLIGLVLIGIFAPKIVAWAVVLVGIIWLIVVFPQIILIVIFSWAVVFLLKD